MKHAAWAAVAWCLAALPTTAQIQSFPYRESFDLSTAPPAGWQANGFTITTTSSRSTPHCLSATGNGSTRKAVTPVFQFGGRVPERIVFYERRTTAALRYRLLLSAISEEPVAEVLLARWDSLPTPNVYVQRSVDLQTISLPGDSGVRFVVEILPDSSNNTGLLRIDDLEVTVLTGVDALPARVSLMPVNPVAGEAVTAALLIRNLGRTFVPSGIAQARWSSREVSGSATGSFQLGGSDSTVVLFSIPSLPPGIASLTFTTFVVGDEATSNDTLNVSLTVGYPRNSLVINEVMFAPTREDEPEWIELFNPGPWSIVPGNLTVSDNSSTRVVVNSPGVDSLRPGAILVISRTTDLAALYPPFLMALATFPSLNNTTPDAVVIRDLAGHVIDSVWYDPSTAMEGRSLERRDWDLPSLDLRSWAFSEDPAGATPGRINSVQRPEVDLAVEKLEVRGDPLLPTEVTLIATVRNVGRRQIEGARMEFVRLPPTTNADGPPFLIDIAPVPSLLPEDSAAVSVRWLEIPDGPSAIAVVAKAEGDEMPCNDTCFANPVRSYASRTMIVNEVMFEPEPGQNEWVELYNPGTAVIDAGGWTMEDLPSASGSVVRLSLPSSLHLIAPGGFLVLAAESTVVSRYSVLSEGGTCVIVFDRASGLGLNNEGDGIVLRDRTGALIDSVRFRSDWHVAGVNAVGRSLERTSASAVGTDAASWTSCPLSDGATPGEANGVSRPDPSAGFAVTVEPDPFSPDDDGQEDELSIRYRLDAASVFLHVRVFDLSGREVSTLASGTFAPAAGRVVWNGRASAGRRVPIGAYIVLVQATDTATGASFTAKRVAVVAR